MQHFGTIRKYTAALLSIFNEFEIQYQSSTGATISKKIPITYTSKEKSKVFDKVTTEQLLSGNYNVLPRCSLALVALVKSENRTTNKNLKINPYRTTDSIEYSFNSVPYELTYELTFQCRGMNEATQIIEQIAPKFNPVVSIDIWDVSNLSEPTRVPVRLLDIGLESQDYEEISSNIFTVTCSISIIGNLYPPIKSQERIKEFQMFFNEYDENYYKSLELLDWEVGLDGYIVDGSLVIDNDIDNTITNSDDTPSEVQRTLILKADRIGIDDSGNYFNSINVESALQEIASDLSTFKSNLDSGFTTIELPDTSEQIIDVFPLALYRTVDYLITCSSYIGFMTNKILIMHDNEQIYKQVYVNLGENLGSFDARISGANIELLFTPLEIDTQVIIKKS